jgi:hypothetical protein
MVNKNALAQFALDAIRSGKLYFFYIDKSGHPVSWLEGLSIGDATSAMIDLSVRSEAGIHIEDGDKAVKEALNIINKKKDD